MRVPRLLALALALSIVGPALLSTAATPPWTSRIPILEDIAWTNFDSVQGVAFDPASGDIWYGSTGGLVRVTGDFRDRHVFSIKNGLPSAYSTDVVLLGNSAWAGTDKGLVRVDRSTLNVTAVTGGPDRLRGSVSAVALYRTSEIWMGTLGVGGAWLDVASGEWRSFEVPPRSDRPTPVSVSGFAFVDDTVWVSTRGAGLLKVDRATAGVTQFRFESGLPTDVLEDVAAGPDGSLWLATQDKGLVRFDPEAAPTERSTRYTTADGLLQNKTLSVAVDGLDVWTGTLNGLSILDTESGEWSAMQRRTGLPANDVRDIEIAGDRLVVGTGVGAALWDAKLRSWTYLVSSNAILDPQTLSTLIEPDRVYVGSELGFSSLDRTTQRWSTFAAKNGLITNRVYEMERQGSRLWLATGNGLWGYDPSKTTWDEIHGIGGTRIHYRLAVDGNVIWLPEWGSGLLRIDTVTGESYRYQPSDGLFETYISDVAPVKDYVWVSTSNSLTGGLHKLERLTNRFVATYDNASSGLQSNQIWQIVPESDNVLWLASTDNGVFKYDTLTRETLAHYNATNGLPENGARAILVEPAKNRLWIGLFASGLALVELGSGKIRVFDVADGLADSHVTSLAVSAGILYATTPLGVSRLDTEGFRFLPQIIPHPITGGGPSPTDPPLTGVDVAITAPPAGATVAGNFTVEGTVVASAADAERVEIRVADGEWVLAQGTQVWRAEVDASRFDVGELKIEARAVAGTRATVPVARVVTVVRAVAQPLEIVHAPPASASAAAPLTIFADVSGDPPLSVTLHYRHADDAGERVLAMSKNGSRYSATVPAAQAREGRFYYWIEATDANGRATSPEDDTASHALSLVAPKAKLRLVPKSTSIEGTPGEAIAIEVEIKNDGDRAASATLSAGGTRAHWVLWDESRVDLSARTSKTRVATVQIPAKAFAGTGTITLKATPERDVASEVAITINVLEADKVVTGTPPAEQDTPAPGVLAGALAALGAAHALRRRRE